jgi:hypothetical protein
LEFPGGSACDCESTSLLTVVAAVVLLAKYWKRLHSTPVQNGDLASPVWAPEKSNEVLLCRAYRRFLFLGLVTLPEEGFSGL